MHVGDMWKTIAVLFVLCLSFSGWNGRVVSDEEATPEAHGKGKSRFHTSGVCAVLCIAELTIPEGQLSLLVSARSL